MQICTKNKYSLCLLIRLSKGDLSQNNRDLVGMNQALQDNRTFGTLDVQDDVLLVKKKSA